MLETLRKYDYKRRHPGMGDVPGRLAPKHWTTHPLGFLPDFGKDAIGAFTMLARRYGDICEFRLGPRRNYFIRDPEAIKRVLVDKATSYQKNTVGYSRMRVFMGQGLVTSQGDFWKRQRRIAQPGFRKKRIAGFFDTMVRMTALTAESWETYARTGEPFDVSREMTRLTLRIVANTVLSLDVDEREDQLGDDVAMLLGFFEASITQLVPIDVHFPTARGRELRATMGRFDDLVYGAIEQRRKAGPDVEHNDLLGMLMEATDVETGERMNDLQLHDEVLTMFLAGHETTANALAWTFHLLGRHPGERKRLEEELDEILGAPNSPREPSFDDLGRLARTGRVLDESMRLYPPAWLVARSAEEDDVLCGCVVEKGSQVFFSPYVSHRDPRYWPDPEQFDSDRFLPEAVKTRPRYAYFPFSGGPRQCIGDGFAKMEAKVGLAMLAHRFELEPVPGHPVVKEPSVTLRPRHGVMVTARRR